ncbi:MAG: hypothetical protein E3K37_08850 [Candidatus Kuenenia sp.]|nr:hypothetical protein [Candidatus Kuenenia hertensis]
MLSENKKYIIFMNFMLFICFCFHNNTVCNAEESNIENFTYKAHRERGRTPVLPQKNPRKNEYQTEVEPFEVTAPSGNTLYGLIRRPSHRLYSGNSFPALIIVPGDIEPGRTLAYSALVKLISEAGIVVACFNAEGRVSEDLDDIASEGTEDYNGFRHQDGLYSIINYVNERDYVIDENIGILSYSFGISMVAGCVSRHPDAAVKYIIDVEGPCDSYTICLEPWGLDNDPSNDLEDNAYELFGHYSLEYDPSEENTAFWEEREAIRYIGDFRGNYLRIQGEWDHALPPSRKREIRKFTKPPVWWQNKHAIDMVDAAIAGGAPWVRINMQEQGNRVNSIYSFKKQPEYLSGSYDEAQTYLRAIIELIRIAG